MPPAAVCKSVCLQDKEEGLYLQLLSARLFAYRTRRRDYVPQLLSVDLSFYWTRIRTMPPAAVCKYVCLQDKEEGLCPQLLSVSLFAYRTRRTDYAPSYFL